MMYELARWDPFADLLGWRRNGLDGGFWAPLLDVEETTEEVVVQAELPGMKKEEIKLQVQGDTLLITGERKSQARTQDKTLHRAERVYGKFQRVIQLPSEVDGSRTRATYEAGVLTIQLPKREEAKPKEIQIEVK